MLETRGKASDFGDFLERTVGHFGYLLGTRGQRMTQAMIDSRLKSSSYKKYWSTIKKYAPQWLKNNPDKSKDGQDAWIVLDCQGWCDAFWNGVDIGVPLPSSPKYSDTSTYTQFALVEKEGLQHGTIDTLPKNCPYPIAVYRTGHVTFYHKGKLYQSKGTAYGTIVSTTIDSNLTGWYLIPYLDYEGWTTESDGEDMLKIGDKGDGVQLWQQALMSWNISALPKFKDDSDYGKETSEWTATFKTSVGLGSDGTTVDALTFGKMAQFFENKVSSLQTELDNVPGNIATLTAERDSAIENEKEKTGELSTLSSIIFKYKPE